MKKENVLYIGCWEKDDIKYHVFQHKGLIEMGRIGVRLTRNTIFIRTLTNEETYKVLKDMNERNFIKIKEGEI